MTAPHPGETRAHCAHVSDLELSRGFASLPSWRSGAPADRTWLLVRLHGEPLGLLVLDVPSAGLPADEVQRRVEDEFADAMAAAQAAPVPFAQAHRDFLAVAPRASVVICTREHPEALRQCLASLQRQDHPGFVTWVVDNAPVSAATRAVVAEFESALDVRYVLEPRPGLSRARNTALAQPLDGEIVAWLDDDEVADPMWLTELVRAFDGRPEVAAASGVVVPAELRTQAQVWFEEFGGHSKGRGFTRAEFSPATRTRQHPLFPLPPFGVGANMAFRTEGLRRLGGFDEALGAGSPTCGSEDTKVFTDLLLSGATTVYQPTALTRHYHRHDLAGLRAQMYGYGSGLTAFYTAEVLEHPARLLTLLRLAPRAAREVLTSSGERSATLGADFPPELMRVNRRGMAAGPWLYLKARRAARRGS